MEQDLKKKEYFFGFVAPICKIGLNVVHVFVMPFYAFSLSVLVNVLSLYTGAKIPKVVLLSFISDFIASFLIKHF